MSNSLLSKTDKGLLFIISAPAGTGKTTLAKMITEEFCGIEESVSCTTRAPRAGEVDGKDYHFLSREDFLAKIKAGEFLEYAEVFGLYYGTLKSSIAAKGSQGIHLLLVIDTQGALQLKGKVDATFIFISPPSLAALDKRLRLRKTESEEVIQRRLKWAVEEMKRLPEYDYHIVNDDLQTAYVALKSIIIAQTHKIRREHD